MNNFPRSTRPSLGASRFEPPIPKPEEVSKAVALITTVLLANDGGEPVITGPISAQLRGATTVAAVAHVAAKVISRTNEGLTVLRQIANDAAGRIVR